MRVAPLVRLTSEFVPLEHNDEDPSNRANLLDWFRIQKIGSMSLLPETSRRLVEVKPDGAVLTSQG